MGILRRLAAVCGVLRRPAASCGFQADPPAHGQLQWKSATLWSNTGHAMEEWPTIRKWSTMGPIAIPVPLTKDGTTSKKLLGLWSGGMSFQKSLTEEQAPIQQQQFREPSAQQQRQGSPPNNNAQAPGNNFRGPRMGARTPSPARPAFQ